MLRGYGPAEAPGRVPMSLSRPQDVTAAASAAPAYDSRHRVPESFNVNGFLIL